MSLCAVLEEEIEQLHGALREAGAARDAAVLRAETLQVSLFEARHKARAFAAAVAGDAAEVAVEECVKEHYLMAELTRKQAEEVERQRALLVPLRPALLVLRDQAVAHRRMHGRGGGGVEGRDKAERGGSAPLDGSARRLTELAYATMCSPEMGAFLDTEGTKTDTNPPPEDSAATPTGGA